jgi:hypothetical protein
MCGGGAEKGAGGRGGGCTQVGSTCQCVRMMCVVTPAQAQCLQDSYMETVHACWCTGPLEQLLCPPITEAVGSRVKYTHGKHSDWTKGSVHAHAQDLCCCGVCADMTSPCSGSSCMASIAATTLCQPKPAAVMHKPFSAVNSSTICCSYSNG